MPALIATLSNILWVVAALFVILLLFWRLGYPRFSLSHVPLYILNTVMTRVMWRATVQGQINLAKGQGAVIVANHIGPMDPAFVALACDRPVHWMVAREFVDGLAYGWALRLLQVIPTNRGGVDIASTKAAVRYAAAGDFVGMFPEGRINTTDKLLLPGRPGAALVALKARVPVIPCFVFDSPRKVENFGFLFERCKPQVRVGEPIDLSEYFDRASDRAVQEELTRRFLKEIAKLGGDDNYEPEIAGKNWKTGAVEDAAPAG